MKINYLKRIAFFLPLILLCLVGCKDEDDTSNLGAVTNVTWEPTNGGAIIRFTAPKSNELLYVKAVYVNAAGNEVFNVVSVYDNVIEIEGLADESKQYPVNLYAVDKDGKESPVTTIMVTPGRSYINLISDNLVMKEIMGGVQVEWENPSLKTVYVSVTYSKEGGEAQTRYLSSSKDQVKLRVRGLKAGDYKFSFAVEDFSGNKTPVKEVGTFSLKEEIELPKYTDDENGFRTYIWTLVADQSTLKNQYEGKNDAIFDGVIDSKEKSNDNSYTLTNRDQYGGSFPWGSDKLDIVIDMHETVYISRVRAWQRAHWYGWSEYAQDWREDGTSLDYYYYQGGNLRSFTLYGSMDATPNSWFVIQDCDIETLGDRQFGTREKWNGHENVWMPTEASYNAALAGHLWELESISEPVRYIRVRMTSSWDKSKAELSGMSELTLYGAIKEDEEE